MNWNGLMMLLSWVGLVEFLFWIISLRVGLLGRKLGFWVKSCFKCFWEISDFGRIRLSCFGIEKHDFIVEHCWFKWLGRVGENGIENGSNIVILRAKWRKTKNRKSCHVCHARPCVLVARTVRTIRTGLYDRV